MPRLDVSILQAALLGLESEKEKIDAAMSAIRKQLGMHVSKTASAVTDGAKPKHRMSAAGRKHIAAAQRKRWAVFHAKQRTSAKKTAPRLKMSAERKAALVAKLAKARAAKAA